MNKSAIFKKAHSLTKATLRKGDNYAATFALCLKHVMAQTADKVETATVKAANGYHTTVIDASIVPYTFADIIVKPLAILSIFILVLQYLIIL